jgi:hypothetical protein
MYICMFVFRIRLKKSFHLNFCDCRRSDLNAFKYSEQASKDNWNKLSRSNVRLILTHGNVKIRRVLLIIPDWGHLTHCRSFWSTKTSFYLQWKKISAYAWWKCPWFQNFDINLNVKYNFSGFKPSTPKGFQAEVREARGRHSRAATAPPDPAAYFLSWHCFEIFFLFWNIRLPVCHPLSLQT